MPMQKPRPDIWFSGAGSPESVVWAAQHGHPYMNLGAVIEATEWLKQIYIDGFGRTGDLPCLPANTPVGRLRLTSNAFRN